MDNSNKVSTTYIIDEQLYDARNEIFKEVARQHKETIYLDDFDPYSKFNPNKRVRLYDEYERDDDEDDEFTYHCDFGEYDIKIFDKQIKVIYEKKSKPMAFHDKIAWKTELKIICNLFDTHEKNISFIESILKHHAHNKLKTLETKIKIFISEDGYWRKHNQITKRNIKTVFLNNKKELIDDIQKFMSSEKLYKEEGRPFKRNYLLYGPPGTGKSSLIFSLASLLELNIYKINLTKGLDDSTLMSNIAKIPRNGMLVFEDIDSLFIKREANSNNKTFITFSSLLNILDSFISKDNLITIMTTNHKDKLDEALMRPGRIDMSIKFDYCDYTQIEEICSHYIKNDKIKVNFIKKIKNIKCTSAALTKFLFEYIKVKEVENICDDKYLDIYISICEHHTNNCNMYT